MTEPREPTDQLGIGATDMTDNTQPEAGSAHIIRYALEMGLLWIGRDKVREALDALDTLEAQLEAIGAGGVSGPLMGRTFDAADMATASAQGFRDGVTSLAASAVSEPVAWALFAENGNIRIWSQKPLQHPAMPLYTHPSPPEGMVGGWIALPGTLPEPGTPVLLDIGKKYPIRAMWAAKHTVEAADDDTDWGEYDEATDTYYCPEGWYEWNECEETHWAVNATPSAWTPLPPTNPAGSRKWE